MPMEDTSSMYEKTTAITIPKPIRDAGGFYDIAKKMSQEDNSKMTLSIIPLESKSLMQLKLATSYPDIAAHRPWLNAKDKFPVDLHGKITH